MKYQLVLQWPSNSIDSYDDMIEVENTLIEGLSEDHEVDGHDAGAGEVNIFIITNDFKAAFNEVRSILQFSEYWTGVRIAYRAMDGSEYVVLWPEGLNEFVVA